MWWDQIKGCSQLFSGALLTEISGSCLATDLWGEGGETTSRQRVSLSQTTTTLMSKNPDNRRQYEHRGLAGFVFFKPHQNSLTSLLSFSSPCRSLFFPLFFSAFLVVYAWQVVADVARNDADGTHNHTEWK